MADEITFGYETGQTLTYGVFEPDGTQRTAPGTALTEAGTTGYYRATDASIQASDLVIVKRGTNTVGFGEFHSDTLESLSDQIDTLQVLGSEQKKQLNEYRDGE